MSDLPQGWEWAALDDLVASRADVVDGPFGSNLKTEHYRDSGPRVVRLQNIGDGHFVDEHAHISEEHFGGLRKHEVIAGDVLVASLGETLPRACVAPESLGRAIVKADCIRIRPADGVHPVYLEAALNSPSVRTAVAAEIQGVGRPRINLSTVRGVQIPVPPVQEQVRIVDELERRLSHVDAAIAGLRSSSRKIRLTRLSVLQEMVLRSPAGHTDITGTSHFWEQLSKEVGREVVPVEEEHTYPRVRLGDILLRIEAGKSYATQGRPASGDEWAVVKVSAMSWGTFLEDENKALPAGVMPNPNIEIKPNDLLISRANTEALVGASVLVGQRRGRLVLSDKSLRLVTAPSINKRWLHAALLSPYVRSQLSALSTGTKESMRNITQSNIRNVTLPLPDRVTQDALIDEAERRLSLIASAEQAVATSLMRAANVRRSLLAAAFAGRLVPQDSTDEPAEVLLERIRAQRAAGALAGVTRTARKRKEQAA